jgi:lipid-A-disaccharide synthase
MPTAKPPSILFIAGDVSGDVHSAALARELLKRDPARVLHALGGARLREVVRQSAGGQFLGDTSNLSAIGIPSAVKVYFRCRELRDVLREFLHKERVDLVELCDWGAFNGACCRSCTPSIAAPLLLPAEFVAAGRLTRTRYRALCHSSRDAVCVVRGATARGRLRGRVGRASGNRERAQPRRSQGDSAIVMRSARTIRWSRCSRARDGARSAYSPANGESSRDHEGKQPASLHRGSAFELVHEARSHLPASIDVVTDCASDLLAAADAAIVKTGTASLEAALSGTPHVAVYDVSWATRIEWCLFWAWRKIPFLRCRTSSSNAKRCRN